MRISNLKNILVLRTIAPSGQCRSFFQEADRRKHYHGRKLIGYSSEQMFDVVTDVENYRRFLPFCKKSDVLIRENTKMKAYLEIGFPPVVESYISEVTLQRPLMTTAVCKDGKLFNHLITTWRFNPGLKSNPRSSIVDFVVDFEFKSLFHSHLAHMFFDRLVKQMENAFLIEAKRRPLLTARQISSSRGNCKAVSTQKEPTTSAGRSWVSYGFDRRNEQSDRIFSHLSLFGGITLGLVLVGYGIMYAPDVNNKQWAQREAFLELRRREAAGLPLIDPNLIDPMKIKLPPQSELDNCEIIV
ncbi:hypothetical protein FQR65_LT08109 [Abscondita terminalis]|nr:hypothetical protein FQR65_LT08109 [Abscondita terminalis]